MRRALLTLLPASMLLIGSAHAGPSSQHWESIVKSAKAQVVVPTDWDGIWTTQDSIYTCEGFSLGALPPGADTLCGGKDYTTASPGTDIVFTCDGTANTTTFDLHCTGSGEVETGCTADYDVVIHGTRSADTFFTVSTINVTYTGDTCPVPSSCTQLNSHGTRTGPTTVADCAVTPTKRPTWGELKVIYR